MDAPPGADAPADPDDPTGPRPLDLALLVERERPWPLVAPGAPV